MKKLMIMAAVALTTSFAAIAGTTASFAYQGVLRDATGGVLSLTQAKITFRLYDAATSGNKLWEKQINVSVDTNGLFNVELSGLGGGTATLADVIATAEKNSYSLYIALEVEGSAGEISPRQKLIASPLAAFAQNVAKAEGDFTVNGTAYFVGPVSMTDNTATLSAANVTASGTMNVSGLTTLGGGASVGGEMTVATSLKVNGVYMSMPIGSIIMWSGSSASLPADGCWKLCNGEGTYKLDGKGDSLPIPDLRDRFIVGAGKSYETGVTGGTNEVTLTVEQMPSHRHNYLGDDVLEKVNSDAAVALTGKEYKFDLSSQEQMNGVRYNTAPTGGDQPHENRPPFYALCYIIKVK